jgi:DNA-binding NarL/FixJ family response regulator
MSELPPLPLNAKLWHAVAGALELSPQHTRAVELLLRGLCNKEIAGVMDISESTLETYFDRIGVRTGARGRTGIFRLVLRVSHEIRDREQMF